MTVRAIVVNYRTAETAVRAVQSLLDDCPEIRVTVVDNDSGDGSLELLQSAGMDHAWCQRVEVVAAPRNGGFGFGNNFAIRRILASAAPPRFLYFLNPDAFVEPGAVAALRAYLDAHPRAGIAGSTVFELDGRVHTSAFRFPSILGDFESTVRLGIASRVLDRWIVAPRTPAESGPVDWVSGSSFMVRREVFELVGLFDESFFLYFEETDLCRRALAAGYETHYVREARVKHIGSLSTGVKDTNRRLPSYWFASRRHYYVKHHGRNYLWGANASWAIGFSLWRLRRRLQGKPDPDPPHLLWDFLRHNVALGSRSD